MASRSLRAVPPAGGSEVTLDGSSAQPAQGLAGWDQLGRGASVASELFGNPLREFFIFQVFHRPPVVSARVFAVAVVRALSPCAVFASRRLLARLRFSVCVVSTGPELRSSGETFTYQPSQDGLSCSSATTVHPSPSLGTCTARSHNLTQK